MIPYIREYLSLDYLKIAVQITLGSEWSEVVKLSSRWKVQKINKLINENVPDLKTSNMEVHLKMLFAF